MSVFIYLPSFVATLVSRTPIILGSALGPLILGNSQNTQEIEDCPQAGQSTWSSNEVTFNSIFYGEIQDLELLQVALLNLHNAGPYGSDLGVL